MFTGQPIERLLDRLDWLQIFDRIVILSIVEIPYIVIPDKIEAVRFSKALGCKGFD
ncbi:hypothetical protein [Chamaesiphon sp. VAR_69_metabat_338]|uniref:hypothetical protein n=1 Tax=Chamaesiphon sp. VAR_69_metabat_338 TaxID=2964704 RepID=UPI00286E725F|nr:hypothetical protein [Chamaesiphon sp. VAR_69_metabat_338]